MCALSKRSNKWFPVKNFPPYLPARGDVFTVPAEKGNISAQYNLGVMYDQGTGVSQDYKKAAEWYQKAAESGDADAQNALGAMYANGEGIPQDYVMAHMYFNLAAASGYKKALENRDFIAEQMTPAQIEKAQELARNWNPKK